MRSEAKHVKKKKKERRGCSVIAWILFFIAVCVALVIGGCIMWIMYGEEGDGKADSSTQVFTIVDSPVEVTRTVPSLRATVSFAARESFRSTPAPSLLPPPTTLILPSTTLLSKVEVPSSTWLPTEI